jgi:hypothetical protein
MIFTVKFVFLMVLVGFEVDSRSINEQIAETSNQKEENASGDLLFGNHFQGDIVLTEDQEDFFKGNSTSKGSRTGLIDTRYRWLKNRLGQVIVPYTLDGSYSENRVQVLTETDEIFQAMTTETEFEPPWTTCNSSSACDSFPDRSFTTKTTLPLYPKMDAGHTWANLVDRKRFLYKGTVV